MNNVFVGKWCGPCKQLGPILEAAVRAQNGKVVMAKLDADANPGLTQQLRVSSLPTVLAVHQGKLVDSFTGLIAEEQVKDFVKRLASMSEQVADDEDPLKVAKVCNLIKKCSIWLLTFTCNRRPWKRSVHFWKSRMQHPKPYNY